MEVITILEVFITNLGRYNEGHLDGEWLSLPASTAEVQALLKRIHVDGLRYEEILITDYDSGIPGLTDCLGEHEDIDELNYLASLLEEMSECELDDFASAVGYGEHTSGVKDLINLTQNLDCYEFYAGIEDEEDLGRYYIEEMCSMEVPEHLQNYIDYEAYGRDIYLEEGGSFVNGGYVVENGSSFVEHYSGRDDIPDAHRIFAYPEQASIRDTLKEYKRMMESVALPVKSRPAPIHDER